MKNIKFKILPVMVIAIITFIVGEVSYRGFLNYQETILNQQRKHLMTISKSIGRSLELYVGEKRKGISELANNFGDHLQGDARDVVEENIFKDFQNFYVSQNKEVENLIYINNDGNFILSYPINTEQKKFIISKENFLKELNYVKEKKRGHVGNPYIDKNGEFSFNILEPVMSGNDLVGVVLGKMRLKDMYKLLVKPVKAGEYGYALVKDSNGTILMHPVKEQIGYDVVESRKERYPGLDYEDLEKLIEKQMKGEEGFYTYYSYWWPQDKLEKIKKLQAFSPANVSNDFWVVSVVMSYDEINGPIKNYLYSNILISTVIIIVLSWLIFLSVRMVKNKESYDMETRYLREINRSTEELRKKEAELHHRRKLETVGTLTGGIAHEFNNILTPIMGYSEMILRNLDPDLDSYECAKSIYRSSKRAREIIDQILVFSGDKNIKIKYEIVSINRVVNEAVKFAETILPSNVKIEKEIEGDCGNLYANETQLHQVILNLCTNACNAMNEKKTGRLKVSLSSMDYREDKALKESGLDKRDYVKISFEDNGCGMDSETMEKIFDPFFTQKLSEKSSGLGLAIVQGIVRKHGGTIKVYSEEGVGSRFEIYIPKTNRWSHEDSDNSEIEEAAGSENVLIVDDDREIVEMLEKGLGELGYKVKSLTDGRAVLKEFGYVKNKFQIVITDLTMPGISGIQVAKKIKENQSETKVILITAHSEEPLEEYMQLKVIDDYVIKPVSVGQLGGKIRKLMDNKV